MNNNNIHGTMNNNNVHGKVIDFKDINKLPKRIEFLDIEEVKKIDSLINNNDTLLFMPCAISEENIPPFKRPTLH